MNSTDFEGPDIIPWWWHNLRYGYHIRLVRCLYKCGHLTLGDTLGLLEMLYCYDDISNQFDPGDTPESEVAFALGGL